MATYFSALNNKITGVGKAPVFLPFLGGTRKTRQLSDGVKGAEPLKILKAPVYGLYAVFFEKLVAFRKMLTAEEAAEGG